MNAESDRRNRAGRRVGAAIFAAGMALLLVVFGLAASAFARVPATLGGPRASSGLGGQLAEVGARVMFLFVMAYVSSLVASKGLDLYEAARREGEE